jgi:PII-like signaling protein
LARIITCIPLAFVEISDHLPLKIEFIESREKVTELLGKAGGTGRNWNDRDSGDHRGKARPDLKPKKSAPPAHLKIEGKAKMMRIYIGEADRWKDKPLYKALVEAMRANDIAGVTVYRGILGYGANRRVHKDKPLHLSHDCLDHALGRRYRGEAAILSSDCGTDGGRRIGRVSNVDIIKYSYRALDIGYFREAVGNGKLFCMSGGLTMKDQFQARMLRIHFGEGDKWQGKPLHEAIVAKCLELGMAGATVYRGIEGYGASTRIRHASHWKLSKDAPIMLSIIDVEEQIEQVDSSSRRDGRGRADRNVFG